jgi:hypothetical protein
MTGIFLWADVVLSSDGLPLSDAGEWTKTCSVRSALTDYFMYSPAVIFLGIDKSAFWY